MPSAKGDKEYILPVKGLNSEANLLHFPQEYSPDLLNMEIDYSPQIVRPRKGIALESIVTKADTRVLGDTNIAINGFLWEAVNKDPDKNFIVIQVGRYIYFFDDTTLVADTERVDLNDLLSGTSLGTIAIAESTRLNFCNVKGNLLMASTAIDPVLFRYESSAIEGTSLTLQMRDVLGIDDGYTVSERPPSSGGLTSDHQYNLLNQGWHKQRRLDPNNTTESDPIGAFLAEFSEYPSNADIPYLGMVEDAGNLIFDPQWLKDQSFGSTPAARGHYIVDIFSTDRAAILAVPEDDGGTLGGSEDWNPNWNGIPKLNLP